MSGQLIREIVDLLMYSDLFQHHTDWQLNNSGRWKTYVTKQENINPL